jgi:hypothetical protein
VIDPESIDFGAQPVGTTSEPQTLTLTNLGDAAEPIPLFDITGDFKYTHACGTSIAPGSSCTVDFTFTPTDVGSRTGEFLAYNEEDGEWVPILPLNGMGIAPNLSISPASLSFPPQEVRPSFFRAKG